MTELNNLKQRAKELGINHHPSIGADKLKAKIINAEETLTFKPKTEPVTVLTPEQVRRQVFIKRKKKANLLVRVRVTCMNPNKKKWQGEIMSVGSANLGTYKKFVPFDAPNGYHIPMIIYNEMKLRKFSQFSIKKNKGVESNTTALVNEFSIEILDPLTKTEIESIAKRQLAGG